MGSVACKKLQYTNTENAISIFLLRKYLDERWPVLNVYYYYKSLFRHLRMS
jgi:hypothetical protein